MSMISLKNIGEMHKSGAQGRIRTTDTRIFSPLLYQLSYLGPLSPRWCAEKCSRFIGRWWACVQRLCVQIYLINHHYLEIETKNT